METSTDKICKSEVESDSFIRIKDASAR
jgi:hypothetical protein